jgi:hypothetical protein
VTYACSKITTEEIRSSSSSPSTMISDLSSPTAQLQYGLSLVTTGAGNLNVEPPSPWLILSVTDPGSQESTPIMWFGSLMASQSLFQTWDEL